MLLAAILLISTSQTDVLATGFVSPPSWARPHTWWHWMDGNVTKEGITADLEAMKEVGIGGAQMFTVAQGIPKGPVDYMSPLWREMTKHAVKEATRLGIELCIHNCAGWSSSGGPWVKPEDAMQTLAWSSIGLDGPVKAEVELPPIKAPQVYANVPYARDIVVYAYRTTPSRALSFPGGNPRTEDLLDVTDKVHNGRLTWDVPEGTWRVLRIGHVPTGKDNHPAPREGDGLEVDKMSRAALKRYWDNGTMAAVLKDLGPLAGKALNNALVDSYEVGNQNWTPLMREEFIKRRGYDPLPWLPVVAGVTIDSPEMSERFMWDWRRTIADLFADNYYGYFGELCRQNGLKFSTEPYDGPFDNLQVGNTADIPMGEFWIGGYDTLRTTKLAASVGHVNGRKVIGAESFTADDVRGRWLENPYAAKALGDLVFCNGVNRYIFHRYAHQPWMDKFPGMTMGPWGTHLERTQTWWTEARAWMKYVARCQYLLQQGQFVADVLYFPGEGAPNDLPIRSELRPGVFIGDDYDGCDTTTLLSAAVKDGRIVLPSGMSYETLIVAERNTKMTPEVARKVRDLVLAGAKVVSPKPTGSPSLVGYPECDEEVRRIAEELWGDMGKGDKRRVGRGYIGTVSKETDIGTLIFVPQPDFLCTARFTPSKPAAFIHRRIGDADVYFVSNQQYRQLDAMFQFRVTGKMPEIWHPDTGLIEEAPMWTEAEGYTVMPMLLDPAESVFVVLRKPSSVPEVRSLSSNAARTFQEVGSLEIRLARYETADGRGKDVTSVVNSMILSGVYEIPATNAAFGDPVVNVVKRLRITYLHNGKEITQTVPEGETIYLLGADFDTKRKPYLVRRMGGKTELLTWKPDGFRVFFNNGGERYVHVTEGAEEVKVEGPWRVDFERGWGAPPRTTFPSLASWTENADDGIKYFSGSAVYTKSFDVPASVLRGDRTVMLDLGKVKNFATVTLNDKDLGVLWKEPFAVDVTKVVRSGRNELKVKVTNLWVNRIIGDEQLPADVEWNGVQLKQWPEWLTKNQARKSGRYTFTTWRFWDKDSPLLESGLIGPVVLRSARWLEVHP